MANLLKKGSHELKRIPRNWMAYGKYFGQIIYLTFINELKINKLKNMCIFFDGETLRENAYTPRLAICSLI